MTVLSELYEKIWRIYMYIHICVYIRTYTYVHVHICILYASRDACMSVHCKLQSTSLKRCRSPSKKTFADKHGVENVHQSMLREEAQLGLSNDDRDGIGTRPSSTRAAVDSRTRTLRFTVATSSSYLPSAGFARRPVTGRRRSVRMDIVNATYLIARETRHSGLVHRRHVITRRLRRRSEKYVQTYMQRREQDDEDELDSHLGTPRSGSGVTDEFRTTPEVFAGAGDTILLG